MAGLWIAHVEVHGDEVYQEYAKKASEILAAHGATFLARGSRYQQMEGRDMPRNVVARFPTFEDAVNCYNSEEYQAAMAPAIEVADRSLVIVESDD